MKKAPKMKICPTCGRMNDDIQTVCARCGMALQDNETYGGNRSGNNRKQSLKSEASTIPELKCPSCKEAVRPWDLFCGKCGAKLNAVKPWPKGKNKQVNKTRIAVVCSAAVLCLTIVGLQKLVQYLSKPDTYYLAPCQNEYGTWGYVDEEGNVLIDFQYDMAFAFNEKGYARVGKQDENSTGDEILCGMIDKDGKEIIACEYDSIIDDIDEYGYFYVGNYNEEQETFISGIGNVDGTVIINDFSSCENIADSGLFIAEDYEGGYGVVDKNYNWTVSPNYTSLLLIYSEDGEPLKVQGEYVFVADYDYDKTGIVNAAGEVLVPFEYEWISNECKSNRISARMYDGYAGALDENLQTALPFEYSSISTFNEDGKAIAVWGETPLILGADGEEQPLENIEYADAFSGNRCAVYANEQAGVIDSNGDWVIPMGNYDSIEIYKDFIVCERFEGEASDSSEELYDRDGNYIFGGNIGFLNYTEIQDAFPILYAGDYYVTNRQGEFITESSYENIEVNEGWINLYNSTAGGGVLISPDAELIDDQYTVYWTNDDTEYITAWETDQYEAGSETERLVNSALLDKNGNFVRSFDDGIYTVGLFEKVR